MARRTIQDAGGGSIELADDQAAPVPGLEMLDGPGPIDLGDDPDGDIAGYDGPVAAGALGEAAREQVAVLRQLRTEVADAVEEVFADLGELDRADLAVDIAGKAFASWLARATG